MSPWRSSISASPKSTRTSSKHTRTGTTSGLTRPTPNATSCFGNSRAPWAWAVGTDEPGVDSIIGDFLDIDSLTPAVKGHDVVVHIGAIGDVYLAATNPELAAAVNEIGERVGPPANGVRCGSTQRCFEGIGGYGAMLIHLQSMAEPTSIEFMTTLPAAATVDNPAVAAIPRSGPGVANVPGTVAGMELAWRRLGSGHELRPDDEGEHTEHQDTKHRLHLCPPVERGPVIRRGPARACGREPWGVIGDGWRSAGPGTPPRAQTGPRRA